MAASDSNNLSNLQKLTATLIISGVLTACGGGGGGGGSDSPADDDRGAGGETLTELPAFLESAKSDCLFVESGAEVSLEDYQGNLANVTALHCNDVTLAGLNEISQLTGLTSLELTNAGLTDVSALLAFASQLQSLNLSGNDLTDLITIGQLGNLQSLDLSDTDLEVIDSLVNLLNLTELNLADNNITDLASLYALTNLEQLNLTGNNELNCPDVFTLRDALETAETGNIILPPAHCATAVELGSASPALITIDNSLEDPAYDRLVVVGDYTLEDLTLQKSGDDFSVILSSVNGDKTITFTKWFTDNLYRLGIFEFPGAGEYSFNQLRDELPLQETLGAGDDEYDGTGDADVINGGAGKDTLDGKGGNDILSGGVGDDIVMGNSGADTLTGGSDKDLLIGDTAVFNEDGSIDRVSSDRSKDTYLFNIGDGADTIVDYNTVYKSNGGVLKFGTGITEAMITLSRTGDDLTFHVNESDNVTIYNWYLSWDYQLEQIQFGDLEPVSAIEFVNYKEAVGGSGDDVFDGTPEDDNIDGGAGKDTIDGKAGNDILSGGVGDDIVMGNSGADTLTGGSDKDLLIGDTAVFNEDGSIDRVSSDRSKDTYLFNIGDGADTIVDYNTVYKSNGGVLKFGTGITEAMITLSRTGDDLTFHVNESDSVTIYNWYLSWDYQLEQIQFGDLEPVSAIEFVSSRKAVGGSGDDVFDGTPEVDNIDGGAGKDTIDGKAGNDILSGGVGDDIVMGNSGADTLTGGSDKDLLIGNTAVFNEDGSIDRVSSDRSKDIYLFNVGDGADTIVDYNTVYIGNGGVLKFGTGITEAMITLSRTGDDLTFHVNESDNVTIYNWYLSWDYQLEQIQFGDLEPVSAIEFVSSRKAVGGSGDDVFDGTPEDDNIDGGAGKDTIDGKAGNDILSGGVGDDIVMGNSGADILTGGSDKDLLIGNTAVFNEDGSIDRVSSDRSKDIYLFNVGDGADTIVDYNTVYIGNGGVLKFGTGITEAMITLSRTGDDLTFHVNESDNVTIYNWYLSWNYQLEQIQFGGGEELSAIEFVESRLP